MIYNFCFVGAGRDTPPPTTFPVEVSSAEWEQYPALLTKSQSGSGVVIDGGIGNETPGRQFPKLFLSELLGDPVFPNVALKTISHQAVQARAQLDRNVIVIVFLIMVFSLTRWDQLKRPCVP